MAKIVSMRTDIQYTDDISEISNTAQNLFLEKKKNKETETDVVYGFSSKILLKLYIYIY